MTIPKHTTALMQKVNAAWKPVPKMSIAEWALANMVLSKGDTAEPGKFNFDRAPYQRGILEAISDGKVEDIVMMTSAQIGKTTVDTCIMGYYIDYEPSPMMLVMPTEKLAKSFSKTRLTNMIKDVPCLKSKLKDASAKDGMNNTMMKVFPGGFLKLVGANSPTDLSSTPVRVIIFDEVDRMPKTVGAEGDPVSLGKKRTKTFWNRKKILSSTPVTKGDSRIEHSFNLTTQEEWCLKCAHCGEYQEPSFDRIDFRRDNSEHVTMTCEKCGSVGEEYEWKRYEGKWIAKYPKRKQRGFHLNEFSSPTTTWAQVISDYLEAENDPLKLKAWWNTALGLPYEMIEDQLDSSIIEERREVYDAEVPEQALVLTAGVDTQDDRLECEVVAWAEDEESWGIEYKVFYGDPAQDAVWEQLDDYLSKSFYYADGSGLGISCTCIDSGGHHTKKVYDFCKGKEVRRIFPIKGMSRPGIPLVHNTSIIKRTGGKLFILGIDNGKETIYSRLKMEYVSGATSGYCHFPKGSDDEKEYVKGYTQKYFEGLTAEKLVEETDKYGRTKYIWKKVKSNARNEPLDCRNYALGAIQIFNPNFEELRRRGVNAMVYNQVQTTKKKKRRVLSSGL